MKKIIKLTAILLLGINTAAAESYYFPSLDAQLDSVTNLDSKSNKEKLDKPIRFSGSMKSFGRFSGYLNKQNISIKGLESNSSNLRFLQGQVVKRRNSKKVFPAFATVYNVNNNVEKLRLFVVLEKRKSRKSKLIEINLNHNHKIKSAESTHINYARSTKYGFNARHCLNDGAGIAIDSDLTGNDIAIKKIYKSFTMLVEADHEYVEAMENPFEEIASQINGVDAIYRRDLGLTINATIDTNPQTYDTPIIQNEEDGTLPIHDEMAQKRPPETRNADVHYLYTGKTPIGEELEFLAGAVPSLAALCRDPYYSVGFTIPYDTKFDIFTTAHEMGHLLNATHDDAETGPNKPGIMNSGTNEIFGEITRFSKYSKSEIGAYVSNFGSCFVDKEVISLTKLKTFKDGKFLAVLVQDSGVALPETSVDVLFRKDNKSAFQVVKSGFTDEEGYFYYKPRKDGSYKFESNEASSKQVKFQKQASRVGRK